MDSVGKFELLEQCDGSVVKFACWLAVEQAGEHDVGKGIHSGDEIKFLKDDSDFRSSVGGEILLAHRMYGFLVDNDFAGVRTVESGEEVEEGTLPGAGWTHNCDESGLAD